MGTNKNARTPLENITDPENPLIDAANKPTTAKVVKGIVPKAQAKPTLPKGVDFDGLYVISHGSVRLGADTFDQGSIVELDTADAVRCLVAGTVRPHDTATREKVARDENREGLLNYAQHMLTPMGLEAFAKKLNDAAAA